jgi:hypothetical protein
MIGSSEHTEQAAVISWARYNVYNWPDLKWLHAIPNGGKLATATARNGHTFPREAMRLKDEGLLPGVSDLFLPAARGGYFGLYIEMKHGRNKPSLEQRDFISAVTERGYKAVVCWSAQEAISALTEYLLEPATKSGC